MKKKEDKKKDIDALRQDLERSQNLFVTGYEKLRVSQDFELRKIVRGAGGKYRVIKNNIADKASEGTPAGQVLGTLRGMTSLAYTEGDPVALDLLVRSAGDIAETIGAAVAQLAGEGPVPVACVGGLFDGAGEQLLTPVREALPSRAKLTPAAGNSLDGAERLATGPAGTYADLIVTHQRARHR